VPVRTASSRAFRNINPAAIVLRGLQQPLVFRFHGPFEQAKHGDVASLKAIERELLDAVTESPRDACRGAS
jgi:hypothetical protein